MKKEEEKSDCCEAEVLTALAEDEAAHQGGTAICYICKKCLKHCNLTGDFN